MFKKFRNAWKLDKKAHSVPYAWMPLPEPPQEAKGWCFLAEPKAEKKAEWTTKRTESHDGEWYCSACGYEPTVFENTSYCPACGRKVTGC